MRDWKAEAEKKAAALQNTLSEHVANIKALTTRNDNLTKALTSEQEANVRLSGELDQANVKILYTGETLKYADNIKDKLTA